MGGAAEGETGAKPPPVTSFPLAAPPFPPLAPLLLLLMLLLLALLLACV